MLRRAQIASTLSSGSVWFLRSKPRLAAEAAGSGLMPNISCAVSAVVPEADRAGAGGCISKCPVEPCHNGNGEAVGIVAAER